MRRPKTPLAELLKPIAKTLRTSTLAIPARAAPATVVELDDDALLKKAMQDVVPLRQDIPYSHPPQAVSPWPQQRLKDEGMVMNDAMSDAWPWDEIKSGEELLYLRAGQKLDTLKRLRRGQWVVQGHLDLHGMNTDEARAAVATFLQTCVRENRRCVRIVHGKGLGSRNKEPVLKNKLRNWLVQRDDVLAFCQARPVDGGAGAALVLVRGPKR